MKKKRNTPLSNIGPRLRGFLPFQSLWRRANARNVSFFTLYGGQFTFSTQLLTLTKLPAILSQRRSATVSLETYPPLFLSGPTCFNEYGSKLNTGNLITGHESTRLGTRRGRERGGGESRNFFQLFAVSSCTGSINGDDNYGTQPRMMHVFKHMSPEEHLRLMRIRDRLEHTQIRCAQENTTWIFLI